MSAADIVCSSLPVCNCVQDDAFRAALLSNTAGRGGETQAGSLAPMAGAGGQEVDAASDDLCFG
jgi:hypothetical protein